MPQSHAPTPSSADQRPPPSAAVVPPVPVPVDVALPAPRVVWDDGTARPLRLVARDWGEGAPSTYEVQAAHGSSWWASGDGTLWVPATGEECWAMLMALAAAVDERTPHSKPAP